jgi:membrane protein DedA with SNARE-associated domain
MAELINRIAEIIQSLIVTVGYPGIFAMQFAENVFPPIPTDTLLPFSGVVAASGRLNIFVVWLSAVLGSIIGSLVLYGLGAWADERVVRSLVRRYGRLMGINEQTMVKAMDWFRRYGAPVVFFGRLVPVMRSVISLTAGMSGMPLPLFLTFTALSSACAQGFWIGIGYVLGENWRMILDVVDHFEPLIIIALGVMLVVGLLFLFRRVVLWRRMTGIQAGE